MTAFDDVAVVDLDGTTLEYYGAGEEIPSVLAADLRNYSYAVESRLLDHPRIRRVVLRMRLRDDVSRLFGVLHWGDGRDLGQVDVAVRAGAAGADELSGGIFAQVSWARCRRCGDDSLVVEHSGLTLRAIPGWDEPRWSTTCPNCGADDFVRHLEAIDD